MEYYTIKVGKFIPDEIIYIPVTLVVHNGQVCFQYKGGKINED